MSVIDARLEELGIKLPEPAEVKGLYRPIVITGNMAYTAGHLPVGPDGQLVLGRVGKSVTAEEGADAARLAGMAILASLKKEIGSLDRVERVVKLFGIVQCSHDFNGQPAVLNGCSQLMADVFGPEKGLGVRSAIGTNSLPLDVCVEIEAIFQIKE